MSLLHLLTWVPHPSRGCRSMVRTSAFQADNAGSIPVIRSQALLGLGVPEYRVMHGSKHAPGKGDTGSER